MSLRKIVAFDSKLMMKAKKHIFTDRDARLRQMLPLIQALFEQVRNQKNLETIPIEHYETIYGIVNKWEDYLAFHGVEIQHPLLPLRDDRDYATLNAPESNLEARNNRRKSIGKVVRISGAKSVAVECILLREHPIYKKSQKMRKTYIVHDEFEIASVGDIVEIRECRPMSKRKHHVLTKVLQHRLYGNADAAVRESSV